jgi:NAD(P)-dependent dehydrogenase (short-subunit alcohol dehydrogenase family)
MDFAEFQATVSEHLIITAAMCQIALKPMYKEKSGRIINLSSISGNYAKRGQTSYAAAKAGIEGLTRTLALEVAHRGITVNAIAPGLIETPMTKDILEKIQSTEGGVRGRIPAGRTGQPEEVGALVAFLCSPDAAYITGTVVTIDGGRSLGDTFS